MKTFDTPLSSASGQNADLSARPGAVAIVASATLIEGLRVRDEAGLRAVSLHGLPADAPVPAALLKGVELLVLEVAAGSAASLDRMARIRASHPGLAIIAAVENADVSLVRTLLRQGVADVAELPFAAPALAAQIAEVASQVTGAIAPGARLAPMVTVAGSLGGCGVTTIITHLAAALARRGSGRRGVCVIDLDLQAGEVACYLGQKPQVTVTALLDAGERLDEELLHSAITDSGHGFDLVAAPEVILPLDHVDDAHLLRLLELARREYDVVLIDLPTDWTSWALSVALASSEVLVVVEASVASMRQARRRLDLFESVGLDRRAVKLVANRVEHRMFRAIGVDQIRDVLEQDLFAVLSDEGSAMRSAQDEGLMITDTHRRSRFASDIEALAAQLTPEGR
jgi:pilus assembly protein CpaE